ncbi:MAG: phosphoribosylanthranilate isomerase [Thermodesulfobacteriota bacterium]|nr:phosphoribosylanthranilate isomerase [Thermodesulfobacteriota bacterium]
MRPSVSSPRIKICGLTLPEQAVQCASLGAHAIGCVFFQKSPRFVSDSQATEICDAVAGQAAVVGIFVNDPFDAIIQKVQRCGLTGVQLHGAEPPELITRLRRKGVIVIKALFTQKTPSFSLADRYSGASAFLTECGEGKLPGGNAQAWNWAEARAINIDRPLILAGGLDPDNIATAITAAMPDAVDVSSGVEVEPGRKDMDKVARFIKAVNNTTVHPTPREIFKET